MTKVITRYFESAESAHKLRYELINRRQFPAKIVRLYDTAEDLAAVLTAADVTAKTAEAYQDRVAKGGAVVMVRAGYKPLNVAKITRELTADMGAIDLGNLVEEVVVKEKPAAQMSVLRGQPLMLSKQRDPSSTNVHMADWPIPLISRRKPATASLFEPHSRMANFPIPLTIRREPFTDSIFGRHARMADFPIPLISKRKPFTGSIFPRHARMARFPIPLISRRKPFTGSIIGRHTRMANWPFPHLINGKTGTNALMPGGPRMANFPIPLLSKRTPSNKSIFPRHARMANFPISLISRRKPFAGSVFPRHARMADFILPLVIKDTDKKPIYGSKRFSLSRLLGVPAVMRR